MNISFMFRIFALYVSILISSGIIAQPVDNKGYFGISAGVSVPVSNFASSDPNNADAGYAQTGFSGYLLPQVRIKDFLGFAGMLGYTSNPYNTSELESQYRANHPSQDYSFSSDSYEMINFLGGISVTVPQGSIDVSLKGYIGLSLALMPATESIYGPVQTGDPVLQLQTEKNRTNALCYGGGVNLLFYASEKIGISLDAIYLHSSPEFNAVELSVYENGELTVLSGIDLKQKFQLIHAGLGVAFMF